MVSSHYTFEIMWEKCTLSQRTFSKLLNNYDRDLYNNDPSIINTKNFKTLVDRVLYLMCGKQEKLNNEHGERSSAIYNKINRNTTCNKISINHLIFSDGVVFLYFPSVLKAKWHKLISNIENGF